MPRITPPPLLVAATALGTAVLAASSLARAQSADLNPVAPNVMLAVDSSGSMEYTSTPASDCTNPPCLPKCYPDVTDTSEHEKSRWIDLVEVLTGTVRNYSCWAQDRSTSDFADEYRLDTVDAVDSQGAYSLPYNRPQSNLCTPGPGVLPSASAPYEYPSGYRADHQYSVSGNALSTLSTCSTWTQLNDGLLDTLNQQIRFGLMTFDTMPSEGTGVSSGVADYASGTAGTWSYFLDPGPCKAVGTPALTTSHCQGNPLGCTTGPFSMEVGARNQYAPPSEGRMVAFGAWDASGTDLSQRNTHIQDVLLMTRPYGATPIAGMLADAREFFWNDQTKDPSDGTKDFGPYSDELVKQGCRRNYLVVLSDGEPNLDMRPSCEGSICPYEEPGTIADDLVNNGTGAKVRTYAIGFAVSEVDPEGDGITTPCEDLADTSYCSDPAYAGNRELQACCTLNEIAFNGTPTADRTTTGVINHALFADNPAELRAALARIFNEALVAVTNRTQPVFTSGSGATTSARAFEFKAAVDVRAADLWHGKLERTRFICGSDGAVSIAPVSETDGDDFVANVQSDPGSRRFYTYIPTDDEHTELSQRPYLPSTVTDGVGNEGPGGTESNANTANDFVSRITANMIGVTDTSCDTASDNIDATQCKDRIMEWLMGLDNGTGYHRCRTPDSSDCNLIGDILHATPLVRGTPSEFLRDESYARFSGLLSKRDTVLYTSSNDGFFHAFFVAPGDPADQELTTKRNNEMWAFVPPAIMEGMPSEYPGTHQLLLDGKPVIKDVIATGDAFPYKLERTRTEAIAQGGTWRTIMVQSFGAQRGGYYALDITKPEVDANDSESGPRFLWQLTTDESGNEIFGTNGTPLITTVFMDTRTGGSDTVREVAVAILPGGDGGSPDGSAGCPSESSITPEDSNFTAVTNVDCYDKPEARSLTIVRLDSGQIIRTFRATGVTEPVTFDSSVLTEIAIPAPLVGAPAAFPAQTGSTADRVFLGDREGRLWRLDVTNTDPARWKMELFFDAYSNPTASTPREPILTAPIMSVDDQGQITINFSTGDQDTLVYTAGLENYVYSLTESIDRTTGDITAKMNWRYVFENGSKVIGPLTLFDRRLFFSVYDPPDSSANACDPGYSNVYGMNYVIPALGGDGNPVEAPATYTSGGKAELPGATTGTFVQFNDADKTEGVIFGVGLRQTPSCAVDVATPNTNAFLGYGTTTSTTSSNPGSFQLVYQKGGGSNQTGQIQSQAVNLAPPRSPVSIDSWAPILE